MALFSREFGIDLGTMYTRVVEGGQLLFAEPTMAAIIVDEQSFGYLKGSNLHFVDSPEGSGFVQ